MLPVNSRLEKKHLCWTKALVDDIKSCFPCEAGNGWNIQKLHETVHMVKDISRFGLPPNFDAGTGKLLLQHFAKHPASTSKCVTQIQFQESIAMRHREHETMRKAQAHLEMTGHVFPKTKTNDLREDDDDDDKAEDDDVLRLSFDRESLIANSLNDAKAAIEDNSKGHEVISDVDATSHNDQNNDDGDDDDDNHLIDGVVDDGDDMGLNDNSSETNTHKPHCQTWEWMTQF